MKNVKNLKVIAAGLCLGATLLTSCGNDKENFNPNEVIIGNISIDYSTEIPTSTISYDKLNKYFKIVTLECDEINYSLLVIKNQTAHVGSRYSSGYDQIEYIDLKSGTTLIKYYVYSNSKKEVSWEIGDNLNIVDEKDITGYLLQEDFVKREYELNEILEFYEEKIKPALVCEQSVNSNEIKYNDSISYDKLCNYGKIISVENDGVCSNYLVMKEEELVILNGSRCNIVNYIDLESSESIIKYHDYDATSKDIWLIGNGLKILEEQDISDYLLQEDFIKREYEVSEIINFYEEKILPTLDSNEKELIK